MIYDARTNPRGFGLRIDQWPRDAQVRRIARMGGYRIPAPSFVAPEATPARALLNHGVWRAWCPDCPFAAEDVWRGHDLFWCMRCGNLKAGRAWRPLIWPANVDEIEATLTGYPPQVQNWEPWGAAVDLRAEAEAWLAKAGAMIDPEHGLSDNAVGGADDPETYTTPVLAVTNAIIASSDANVDKGDIRYFRQYLSANPSGANEWLQSTGADGASWVARATAVIAAIPNGGITTALLADLNVTLGKMALNSVDTDRIVDASVTTAKMASSAVTTAKIADLNVTLGKLATNSVDRDRLIDGEVIEAKLATGAVTTNKLGAFAVTLGNMATDSVDTDRLVNSSVTTAKMADANVTAGKLASGAAVSNIGYTPARIASGTYTGNGGTTARQITTGFAVKLVIVHDSANDTSYTAINTTNSIRLASGSVQGSAAVHTHASDGFVVADGSVQGNVNTNTYSYTALG